MLGDVNPTAGLSKILLCPPEDFMGEVKFIFQICPSYSLILFFLKTE